MINNEEMNELMQKLESLEDQTLATKLLSELSEKTKALGKLVMNLNPGLGHAQWKAQCDLAREEVELIIKKIQAL